MASMTQWLFDPSPSNQNQLPWKTAPYSSTSQSLTTALFPLSVPTQRHCFTNNVISLICAWFAPGLRLVRAPW